MPENPGLYRRLTVTENLQLFAGLYQQRNAAVRIGEALEAVNLTARAHDLCGSLSKGLLQRVGLARALLNDPAVMFLDEPTSGLDPVATREVYDLINGLRQRGVTVFLTTHRLEEAERLCDRVAILNTTLRLVGRPDELRERLFTRSLVGRDLDSRSSRQRGLQQHGRRRKLAARRREQLRARPSPIRGMSHRKSREHSLPPVPTSFRSASRATPSKTSICS